MTRPGRASAGIAAVALVSVAAALVACGDGTYVFLARRYDAARGCLESLTSVDVLNGSAAATSCEPVCLVKGARAGAAEAVYVTTVCAPYPSDLDPAGTHALCAVALDAHRRGAFCSRDGGTAPAPLPDAGSDASAD